MVDLPEVGAAAVDHKEYFFSSWYPIVQQHTMKTTSFPLEKKEAEVLIRYREVARTKHYVLQHQKERGTKEEDIEKEMKKEQIQEWARRAEDMRLTFSTFSLEKYPPVSLSEKEEEILKGLKEKIDGAIQELGTEGAFLKLRFFFHFLSFSLFPPSFLIPFPFLFFSFSFLFSFPPVVEVLKMLQCSQIPTPPFSKRKLTE